MGGGRARRRYEPVNDEKVEYEVELVEGVDELVGAEVEEIEDVEVVGPGEGVVSSIDSSSWLLPRSVKAIELLVLREAVYGGCLVELRRKLRELGELDDYRLKEINREIAFIRSRLYELGLHLETLTGCRRQSGLIAKLCEWVRSHGPRYASVRRGADNPQLLLYLLKLYLPDCYRLVTGEARVKGGEDYGLRALSE